jgi:hypothetical protein
MSLRSQLEEFVNRVNGRDVLLRQWRRLDWSDEDDWHGLGTWRVGSNYGRLVGSGKVKAFECAKVNLRVRKISIRMFEEV